jgi:glyoxylase-like metal-dependent hydrolase (beta-lactamase superfamily II)
MLRVIEHGPVRELEMSTRLSRALGFKVSAFVVRGFLIDTGFPRVAGELGVALERVALEGALVTHWHEDHAGNLALLTRRGVPVAISRETLDLFPRTYRLPRYRWAIWGNAEPPAAAPVAAAHPFEIVPTPGHTTDHVAVYDPESGTVFGGDLFLGVKASVVHPGEDPRAMLASVRRILALEPRRYFDAHRSLVRDPGGALRAKAQWLEATIDAIEAGVRRGDPDAVIQARVIGRDGAMAAVTGGGMSKRNFVAAVRSGMRRTDPDRG